MPLLGASEVLQVTRFGPKYPRAPNSRGSIGTSDNFYILMTTGPPIMRAMPESKRRLMSSLNELYSIVLCGIACYFIVLHGTA